ncbi:unnamed protein product [Prorocentrum cordatum]|uniref:Uncharacterized protein n=1 Tax=Prorocentrum cordatum TaxID=2364126 RepID=A0ABN9R096_9DINO|nr:unnamed protein product [Polarella glacialis]
MLDENNAALMLGGHWWRAQGVAPDAQSEFVKVVKSKHRGSAFEDRVGDRRSSDDAAGPNMEDIGNRAEAIATHQEGGEVKEEADDARVLWIMIDEGGERHKVWRAVAREIDCHSFFDWPFEDQHSKMFAHGEENLSAWGTPTVVAGHPVVRERGTSQNRRTAIDMTTPR